MGSTDMPLPYWQINVSASERTVECPPYLQNISQFDIGQVSILDSEYERMSWPTLKQIIGANKLDHLRRVPSDLRRYFDFRYRIKNEYGSIMEFILKHRLGWETPIVPEAEPFGSVNDIKILYNDWPYGIDKKVVHLVVWTKFDLEDDPQTDDLTPEARKQIDDYVDETFCKKVGKENVIWFKNWRSLKSVSAVEHFHVMLYDAEPEFLKEITGGDVPLSQKV